MKYGTANRPLRIALIGDGNSPNTERWCKGLKAAGCQINLFTFAGGNPHCQKLIQIPIPKFPGNLHYLVAVPWLKRALRKTKTELTVGYSASGYGIMAALTARTPLVICATGTDVLHAHKHSALKNWLTGKALKRADLIVTWERHMVDPIVSYGIDERKILSMPTGIDLDDIRFKSAKSRKKIKHIGIVSTRRLDKKYRLDSLISAFGLFLKSNTDVMLTIVGDGPEVSALKKMANEFEIDKKVRFLDYVPNDQIGTILGTQQIYISLCPTDGVSASLLEAMAAGLLPVTMDHPSNRKWITDKKNGILLNYDDPTYLSKKLNEAVLMLPNLPEISELNYQIVKERADLFANSKHYVKRFKDLLN